MAISRVQAGSYARNGQAWAQQTRRSMSLTTLTRESKAEALVALPLNR